jgi:putative ABC transport system substrate-binding protein
MFDMRRREFITLLGGAVAWPLAVGAQQSTMPVIGCLSALSQTESSVWLAAFRRGLSQSGFVEGRSVIIESRFADGQYGRLPELATELARRPVNLILAVAPPAALAAKAATTTIPIVFIVGFDPVVAGLVDSLNRPGGNATGMTLIGTDLAEKRLEILVELVPNASNIAILVNPASPNLTPEVDAVQGLAQRRGLQLQILHASTPSQLDTVFASLDQRPPHALVVAPDPFYVLRREELAERLVRLAIPTIYPFRDFPASGGLISYGTNIAEAYRQAGIYTARILRGTNPADLPVMQPTRLELVINLKVAKALGLGIPPTLLARADEVIE